MLSTLYQSGLAGYCEARALWAEAMEHVHEEGAIVDGPQGWRRNARLMVANKAEDQMRKWAAVGQGGMRLPGGGLGGSLLAVPQMYAVSRFWAHRAGACFVAPRPLAGPW